MADDILDNGSIGDAHDLVSGDVEEVIIPDDNIGNVDITVHDEDNVQKIHLRQTKSSQSTTTASPLSTPAHNKQSQFTRRPSDDDFTKMSMLSKRGGGFVIRGGNNVTSTDPELPEIPEMPFDSLHPHRGFEAFSSSGVSRTQSERYPRGHRRHGAAANFASTSEDQPDVPPPSAKTPTRIPSFRIPSKLRVLPTLRGGRKPQPDDDDNENEYGHVNKVPRDTYIDETMWNDEPSGESVSPLTPQSEEPADVANTWSFSSNEGLDLNGKPRSRASTLDRRNRPTGNTVEIGVKSSPVVSVKRVSSSRRHAPQAPPPTCPPARHPAYSSNRMLSKRRSVSDLNIPMSLQQSLNKQADAAAAISSAARQSIHFDESKKSLGRWLAKMLLGAKYGEPACHRIRRISREVVTEMLENSGTGQREIPHISRVLMVGESGVGKHELVRNFRNIGADPSTLPASSMDDPLNDIISRGTSFSDSASDDNIDPAQLIAFEYNEQLLVLDFLYADTEEEFVRFLIQRPPDLIVATYSVCSSSSLDFCISMMERLRHHGCEIPLALVGNKSDLVVARTISKHESRSLAKQFGITLLEVSALLGEKCPELLLGVLRQLTRKPVSRQPSGSAQHDNLGPQNSGGSGKSNATIWSRLSKTFSNKPDK